MVDDESRLSEKVFWRNLFLIFVSFSNLESF